MAKKDVYPRVAEKLGYPNSVACVNYLKVVMTPEEGELLLEFIVPATCREVATRLKTSEKSLQDKLDNLMRRGLLYHGKTQYLFQFGIHAFFNRFPHNKDENIPPEFWRAWAEFHPEEVERIWMPMWTLGSLSPVPMFGRVIPHRLALDASPKVRPEQILWYEDYHEILKWEGKKGVIGVVDCPCRREFHNCDRAKWTCFYFNEFAAPDLDPKRESRMKIISVEEAMAYADEAEKTGLVHMCNGNDDFSTMPPNVFCNCCDDCCVVLGPALRSGRLRQTLSPSRYRAVVDTELCKGCKQCISRCFFSAIQMRQTPNSKVKKAHVLGENCLGCGACVTGCKQKAITLELVRPPEHIPSQKASGSGQKAGGSGGLETAMSHRIFGYSQAELK